MSDFQAYKHIALYDFTSKNAITIIYFEINA